MENRIRKKSCKLTLRWKSEYAFTISMTECSRGTGTYGFAEVSRRKITLFGGAECSCSVLFSNPFFGWIDPAENGSVLRGYFKPHLLSWVMFPGFAALGAVGGYLSQSVLGFMVSLFCMFLLIREIRHPERLPICQRLLDLLENRLMVSAASIVKRDTQEPGNCEEE